MSDLRFIAMEDQTVAAFRAGAPDINAQAPERHISTGGLPCRHCLADITEGDPYLILAHRPFPEAQPYAEQGPIFLHADECPRHPEGKGVPEMFLSRETVMLRGYGADDRIVYGTGQVVASGEIERVAGEILAHDRVHYVHMRSASNNCFQCRIE